MTDTHLGFFVAMLLVIAPAGAAALQSTAAPSATGRVSTQPLLDFKESEIRFDLRRMMTLLRDRDHEGWVLAAYPDPNTGRPLIGAGFSLDVAATDHPQLDPFNPRSFIEPSAAQLWQAAGLTPEQLRQILDEFDRHLRSWGTEDYSKKVRHKRLPAQLTEEEATRLLRISAIQATVNARAYCRNFDSLTGGQQMGLSQLAFQMGVNLDQFVDFLSALNGDALLIGELSGFPKREAETEAEHWHAVQAALIDSQWARKYTVRAITVVAMFDPNYARDPQAAQRGVEAVLKPPVKAHRKSAHQGHGSGGKSRKNSG